MSYGFGAFWILPFLMQIVQIVLGIVALRMNKAAGWMMIAAPLLGIVSYAVLFSSRSWAGTSSGPNFFYYAAMIMPSLGQMLFYAGVFMIVLQAKAVKKRAEEQQMLLDEMSSRQ